MQIRNHDAVPDLLLPADLSRHIETLQEELRLEHDRYIRTVADLTNYRRRTEREASRCADQGKREVILPLLGIVDDIENALRWAVGGDQPFVEGIRLIHQRLLALVEAQGVRPYDSIHTMFDHDLHDAVAVTECAGKPAGIIVDELRRGYLWQTGVLRAAQVRVAG